MPAALVFLWFVLTTPADRIACVLWTKDPPPGAVLRQSCGFDDLAGLRVDLVDLDTGAVTCARPAGDSLATIPGECKLPRPLDQYELRLVDPDFTEFVCSIKIEHEGPPMRGEIESACGVDVLLKLDDGRDYMQLVSTQPKPEPAPRVCQAPPLPVGFGLYDQAPEVAALWTNEPLTWLAGRMIWFGMIRPSCEGGRSGLDPDTLAADGCGMAAAQWAVTQWQNRFNDDIYAAALRYGVPARLIKRIIAVESQYWPAWDNSGGEAGMLQVSPNGADVLLRYDPDLDPQYPRRPVDQQYWRRLDVLRVLACAGCGLSQSIEHMHAAIPIYARLLAAYRCRAVEINPELAGAAAWRQAAADYNGNPNYLREVEQ